MAEIYKTKRSPFWYLTYVENGIRYRKSLKVTSKEEARQIKIQTESALAKGEAILKKGAVNLKDGIEEYLIYCETHHAPGTMWVNKSALSHFLSITGDLPLSQISLKTMDEYKTSRKGNAATATVNRELGVVKAFIGYMVDRGSISRSPFKSRDGKNLVKSLPNEQKKIRFLSIQEIRALLEKSGEPWRSVISFALNTGLRRNEIRYLRWDNIDLEKRLLSVEPFGDFHIKNRRLRHIPLNNEALRICSTLPKRGIFVFGGNNPFMIGHFNHKFKAVALASGLPGVGFHTLRHTFASHLVMAGVPVVTVQSLLGHSNIQTTMVYAHLSKDHKAQAVSALDLGLSSSKLPEA